ncbi:MAG: EthD domain-containing protein, partial [Pseudomonadales bacterium]
MIRLTFLLRRKAELSREAFQQYWLEQHGPLVASHARRLSVLRYVQVHTLDDPANEAMAKARGGMEEPYDGVAELWFEDRDRLTDAFAT